MQIPDDSDLLNQMMNDMQTANDLYKPTNYWQHYQRSFLLELKLRGLKDFRRRRGSVLVSFGATDLLVKPRLRLRKSFRGAGVITGILNLILQKMPMVSLEVYGINPEKITGYFYNYTKHKFEESRFRLIDCPANDWGNPEDLVEIDSMKWSTSHLQYCSQFIDANRFIDFKGDDWIICELGAGLGRSTEVMAQLLPRATFLLFDIPPQLYVANQYLRSVFGSRVITYRTAISYEPAEDIAEELRGKIIILPSWKMPDWSKTKIDLFWNSASFQEMEPDVVQNYLELVIRMRPEWIYIHAGPEGHNWGEWKPGRGGTKKPVVESIYVTTLEKSYECYYAYPTDLFMCASSYKSCIFRRKP